MRVRTTVRLPEELLDRATRKAAAEGRTLNSLIEDGLRLAVTGTQKVSQHKRSLPRISKATGGAMSGIEFTDSATLQEIDDLDYIGRLKNFK
jgi:ribbon-helix-helix CopG family protein